MKTTAFVSHFDCARHDTGWGHPDHQGRLPALTRAVYADMLTLFDPLLDLEGRHASREELRLWHSDRYLEQVRGWVGTAEANGRPMEIAPRLVASGATWDASLAAVGCVLTGIDAVASGRSRNAFCAVRPPARDAGEEKPGRFGFLNALAIGAEYALDCGVAERVLLIEWGAGSTPDGVGTGGRTRFVRFGSPPGDDAAFLEGQGRLLEDAFGEFLPDVILLSAGFDWLDDDPESGGGLTPAGYYAATAGIREIAEARCGGRLVSVLEGGYGPRGPGVAVVQHLRALAGLAPVS